ncbi:MAG: translation initiation factor IF-2, partial [Bacteroidota bacterium]
EFGHEVEFISLEEQTDDEVEVEDAPEDLKPRSPIITVMGHVDHGKTSLLDYIRNAKVAAGEAGGITQHIGAYEVEVEGQRITFLDTPGHEAFTAMRARGAKVTDIAIIIVAADDSVMPQTREAISHAQAAGVPIVFAINKIDKPGASPDRIKTELAQMNMQVEEWGGKYQSQEISAKTGEGIDELLEKVLLEAEILELKANPDRKSVGAILEASLDKGRGYVTKSLIQTGTLRIGDAIVAGEYSGKVKAMFNEHGKRIKEAGPSKPVLILGLNGAPQAGERFKEMDSETDARQVATKRGRINREQLNRATKRISLDEIGRRLALGNFKELNLIVKGDVDGSIEALSDSLIKLSIETVQVNVIHKAVGQIIESDILLASASDAIIIGFQVRPSLNARKLAEKEGVEVKTYSIIYEAIEEIKLAIEGLLEPTKEEEITANVLIRETYKISKVGTIAGCYVQDGKIERSSNVRVIRDGIVIYPTKENVVGKIASLKRFKDDVKEVKAGMECGLNVENFNDIKVGDIIEAYEIREIKQKLA